ncbi:MAG: carboxymuconolactone decarboxylase family protein [Spirochaetota bacterium]
MLDNRIKELIAVGASITANCQPCLQYHVTKALESGAAEQEITEAVEVGKMVRKGAASKMDKFASSLAQAVPSVATTSDEGCGCSA